jgi:hypothetical protein
MPEPGEGKLLDTLEGVTEVDPQRVQEFRRLMTEEVIPEIVKAVEERRLRAAESRQWQLKLV